MSQENVEIVRALFATWNAGDMDANRELSHPDVIVRMPEGWPEPGPFVGQEAVMRQWERQREAFDADALEWISAFTDVGDRVVGRFIWHGAGRGPEADLEMTGVWTVRKGKILSVEFFWDHVEALETLGLSGRAMSQENIEVVRAILAAWERGDWSSAEWAHPEIEFVIADGPSPGSWTGLAGMAEGAREVLSAWEDFRFEAEGYRVLDDERVLALFRFSGRGKTSGLEVGQMGAKGAELFHLRESKVTRLVAYMNYEHALADLDLSEQDAHAES